ncbi:MAG: hypothetical protein AAB362_00650, partial [Patescibacteria group bacterium]
MSNDSRIANIPQLLPLYAAEPDGRVIFPGMPVRMLDCRKLPEQPFCIVASYWNGEPMTNCGIIGEIICVDRKGEKRFYFKGIVRVYFCIENRDNKNVQVRWIPFNEINDLTENRSERKQLKKRILRSREILKRYISLLLEQHEEKTKEFLKDEFAVCAIERVLSIKEESLIMTCDDIMNIANAVAIPNGEIERTHAFSQVVLAEKFCRVRLFFVYDYLTQVLGNKKNDAIMNVPIGDGKASE